MIYKFTYYYKEHMLTKVCVSLREAELFFNVLLALHCDYIKVITFTKKCK